ncbi:MAG: hypothetical protein IJU52_04260 [Clostridia bacterium]|nr:hypothetical protein [Clostridia bacterium]
MNTQVTATGLQVTAKSNSTYLLIDNIDNATDKSTSADTKAAAFVSGGTNAETSVGAGDGNTDKIVYPTYYAAANGTMPGTADGTTNLSVTAGHWYTANNRNSDNANNATKNVRDLGTSAPVNYVVTYNAWLTLSQDSEAYTGKIKLTSSVASGDAGTSVVIVLNDGTTTETLKLTNGTQATTTNNFSITATSSVAVTFYVYIDGTTTNVNSDYVNTPNTLTGNLSVQFDLA